MSARPLPTRGRRVPVGRRRGRGLTLLELLIVLGILVLMIGLGISGLGGMSSTQLRTQTNRLSAAIRYTYNRSVAQGLYMRMVFDLDGDAYWVEASDRPVFMSKQKRDVGEDLEAADEEALRGLDEKEIARIKSKRARYQEDGLIPRVAMEKGIGLDGVLTVGQTDVFSSGRAYLHFFPNGFVEPALIYTTDGDESFMTLEVNPLTGKVTRTAGKVDPPRRFGEPEKVEDEGR
ncbi:MAG: hypothetical protein KC613_16930 [Myxococcales bacterium]|nr:hypothetical protein [Myxococcales bacterium]MCB9522128.1 hypothetical protein [Myxococcales bacterium]